MILYIIPQNFFTNDFFLISNTKSDFPTLRTKKTILQNCARLFHVNFNEPISRKIREPFSVPNIPVFELPLDFYPIINNFSNLPKMRKFISPELYMGKSRAKSVNLFESHHSIHPSLIQHPL